MTPCHLRQAQPAVAGPRATARLVPGTRQQPPGRCVPAAAGCGLRCERDRGRSAVRAAPRTRTWQTLALPDPPRPRTPTRRRPLTPAAASHSPVAPAARVQQQQQRQQRSVAARGASAAAAAAAAAAASQALLPAQLQALGGFILSCACSLFLLAAVPAMIALARMAHRAEAVLRVSLGYNLCLLLVVTGCLLWRSCSCAAGEHWRCLLLWLCSTACLTSPPPLAQRRLSRLSFLIQPRP